MTQPILIIEDSDDDFEAAERAFKKVNRLNNPIYRCEEGQEALDFLFHKGRYINGENAPRPGIILLDLNMPGRDGRAVLQEIKNSASLKSIPVVILTNSDDEKDIKGCYQNGANGYIKKPVDLDGFFAAIKRLEEYRYEISILPKG